MSGLFSNTDKFDYAASEAFGYKVISSAPPSSKDYPDIFLVFRSLNNEISICTPNLAGQEPQLLFGKPSGFALDISMSKFLDIEYRKNPLNYRGSGNQ